MFVFLAVALAARSRVFAVARAAFLVFVFVFVCGVFVVGRLSCVFVFCVVGGFVLFFSPWRWPPFVLVL